MERDGRARQQSWAKTGLAKVKTKRVVERWRPINTGAALPLMQDGKDWLKSYTDQGRNDVAAWLRVPGGDAARVTFICNAHEGCPVRVKLVMRASAGCTPMHNEADHTAEINAYDRANATLTRAEKSDLAAAIRFGSGTAGKVKFEHECSALLKGAKRREEEAGGGVKGDCKRIHDASKCTAIHQNVR